ncbi:hypothetical protein FQN57_002528 [Myotisia sp. PD_48]|nr:hypothetical protein FQN57_002528 [Myotisia sp. PD_48]
MDLTPISSHDTEPLSSTALSRVRRTLTAPEADAPLSSIRGRDALSVPLPFDIIIPQYRPDGFPAPDNMSFPSFNTHGILDDPGIANSIAEQAPEEHITPEPTSPQCEATEEYINVEHTDELQGTYHFQEFESIVENEDAARADIGFPEESEEEQDQSTPPPTENPQIEEFIEPIQAPQLPTSPAVSILDPVPVERPTKRPRKGRKKKLKRGKTTSAAVRKRVESDIEDDVIWVEDKKVDTAVIDDTDASEDILNMDGPREFLNPPAKEDTPLLEIDKHQLEANETNQPNSNLPETNDITPIDPPATKVPKKRGRKRKATTTTPTIEPEPTVLLPVEEPPKKAVIPTVEIPASDCSSRNSLSPPPEPNHQDTMTNRNETVADVQDGSPVLGNSKDDASGRTEIDTPPRLETPKKSTGAKGPDKHSPIAITNKVSYRVGLSRKARIAPLLRIIRK